MILISISQNSNLISIDLINMYPMNLELKKNNDQKFIDFDLKLQELSENVGVLIQKDNDFTGEKVSEIGEFSSIKLSLNNLELIVKL